MSNFGGGGFGGFCFGNAQKQDDKPQQRIIRRADGTYGPPPDLSKFPEIPARVSASSLPLDPRPYRTRIQEMITDLQTNTNIEVEKFHIGDPIEDRVMENFKNRFPSAISDEMEKFYRNCDGFSVKWRVRPEAGGDPDSNTFTGRINMLPMEDTFGQDWFVDDPYESHLKPIDMMFDEAYACLTLPPGTSGGHREHKPAAAGGGADDKKKSSKENKEEEPVERPPPPGTRVNGNLTISLKTSSTLHANDLRLDFGMYVELLLRSRGYFLWQSAIFADIDGEECTVEPSNFRKMMPKLFNDYDANFFLRRASEYAEIDFKKERERNEKVEAVRKAIDRSGADVSLDASGTGYISIHFKPGEPTADNDDKVRELAKLLGFSELGDFENFGARSLSNVMFVLDR